jgi:ubiquinone/menaquinone biosynthesis C-methylase UbiE
MEFKKIFFANYLKEAPLPLAIERSLECELLNKQKFSRPILDLGCGEGLFAYILFDEKIDVGIDPDNKEIEKAKRYGMHTELIHCPGNIIPKESNSFNTIFSNSVLEHIPDIEPVLKEAHRLLTSHGEFYITVPTNLFDRYSVIYQLLTLVRLHAAAEKFRFFFNMFWKHYHFYDERGWRRLFQKNGFEVLSVQEYCCKKICLVNDALAPFSIMSFISKKLLNKWFILGWLRIRYSQLLYQSFKNILKSDYKIRNGGLIFFRLCKRSST